MHDAKKIGIADIIEDIMSAIMKKENSADIYIDLNSSKKKTCSHIQEIITETLQKATGRK